MEASVRTVVCTDAEALASEAAGWLCERALASNGRFAVCLAGGSTPRRLYENLASEPLNGRFPWPRVHWFWGDERFVPQDSDDSNYRMARAAMLDRVPVPPGNVHAVDTRLLNPAAAAEAYERNLQAFYGATSFDRARPLFDVMLLGLGEDGHTASLFPGSAALAEREAWAVAVVGERPQARITLTYPAIESSRDVAFIVSGRGKRDVVEAIRRGENLPAARIKPAGNLHWFLDRDAI